MMILNQPYAYMMITEQKLEPVFEVWPVNFECKALVGKITFPIFSANGES